MSIRIAPTPPPTLTLAREARSASAQAFGLVAAATWFLILGGAVAVVPALVGLALFAGLLAVLPSRLAAHHSHPRLGIANRITLVRAAVACFIGISAIDPAPFGDADRWVLAAGAAAALLLDGADGWAARRQGLVSVFGARFDMETDAFSILVLAIAVAKTAAVPYWVLLIGAMRYLYLGAGRILPLLRRSPPAYPAADLRRKTIAVAQSVALILALAPATSPSRAAAICAVALGLLVYSFAADIVMLLSSRAEGVGPE